MAAILESATRLFAARGFATTSTNQIAAAAGVSVGSLYQYFPNKAAIATAIVTAHHRAIETIVGDTLNRLSSPSHPLRLVLQEMFEAIARHHDSNPPEAEVTGLIAHQSAEIDNLLRQRGDRFRTHLETALSHRRDIRSTNISLLADLTASTLETLVRELMHERLSQYPRAEAIRDTVEFVCRAIEVRT